MKIAITGGTGFLGKAIVEEAITRGHQMLILSRNPGRSTPTPGTEMIQWPLNSQSSLPPHDAVINLAGESISGYWTAAKKEEILRSRRDGTHRLVDALAAMPADAGRPKTLVSASAVGYYGDRGEEVITEDTAPDSNFLAEVCKVWEEEAVRAETLGMRVARIRIGVVLGRGGGALEKLLPPFKMGVGGPLGNGKQWFPWVHQLDIVEMFLQAVENPEWSGPFNGVAPGIVRGKEFAQELGKALHRPALIPTPLFGLKLLLGEFANHLVESQHILPQAAQGHGYSFQFPQLAEALQNIVA